MSRRFVTLRIVLAAAAISALAACASPTAPTSSHLKTPTINRIGTDTTCRSGYSTGQGFHC
jgi:hypothetical protein